MDSSDDGGPARGRLALFGAAAALLVAVGIGIATMTGTDGGSGGRATEPAASSSAAPDTATPSGAGAATATYSLPGAAPQARCIPPNPTGIQELDVAFQGTVTEADDQRVVLQPQRTFAGDEVARVVLEYDAGAAIAELLPVDFRAGRDYIVAVKDGTVQLCGYTAPASAGLADTYASALR